MEDPKYVKSDGSGLCRLVAIKNRYSCDIYQGFRNLAEDPPLDKPGTNTITIQRAAGLIELESLRILNLIEATCMQIRTEEKDDNSHKKDS